MVIQKSLCQWLPLLHKCVTLVKHFLKNFMNNTNTGGPDGKAIAYIKKEIRAGRAEQLKGVE